MATGFEDLGAVEEPKEQAHGFEDLGAVPETQRNDFSDLGAVPVEDFNPAAHAVETGDKEAAFQARQALKHRTFGEKAKAVGNTLLKPETYGSAALGAGKFALGVLSTVPHTLAQAVATKAAPIARGAGMDEAANWLENEQQTQGAEATLAAQHVEQGLRGAARGIRNVAQDTVLSEDDARERAHFDEEIAAYKAEQQLAQQRPLETGAVATAAKLATGRGVVGEAYSPEALQAQGARPVSPLLTESMAAAADPINLALPLAGKIPGVSTLAGGLVQGAGKILRAPEAVISYIPKVAHLKRLGKGLATAGAVYEGVRHPEEAAKIAGIYLLGKALGGVGRGLDAQGRALRTGIPSALDITAQSAASAGKSAISTNAQRLIGNTAGHVASTAIGFAPVNYAMAGGDPEKFAESEVGAGVMGALFALPGETFANQRQMAGIASYRLATDGQQPFTDNPAYAAHNAKVATFAPQHQAAFNKLRSFFYRGLGTDVLALDQNSYAQTAGQIGANTRGHFVASPDGKTIYINADAIGGSSRAADTVGHEAGHAVVDFLMKAGREGDAHALFDSIKKSLTPEQLAALTNEYRGALSRGTPAKPEESPAQRAGIEAQIARDNPESKIVEENLSEITRRILSGEDVSSFALPKPLLEKLTDVAAQFLEGRNLLPKIDAGADLGFKAQAVKEAARGMRNVLYETGQRAIASIDVGQTTMRRIMELRQKVAQSPPVTPTMPVAQANAVTRQKEADARELAKWEKEAGINQTPKTPFQTATAPPVVPSAPQAPPTSAPPSKARVAAILRQQGLSAEEASKWAESAQGATPEEAAIDAIKKRAQQKFPTTPPTQPAQLTKPTEPTAEPIATPNGPVPPQTPSESLPTGGENILTSDRPNTAPTESVSVPTDYQSIAARARESFLADKPPAKAGRNRDQHTAENQKAADKAAFDAAAEAHAENLPENYQGIRQRVDAFGQKTVSGTVDPSRPFDAWLIRQAKESGMLNDASLQTLLNLQDSIGKTISYDYGHAKVADEGDMPTSIGRAKQQAEHTVAKRLSGESEQQTERKTSMPLSVRFNSGTKSFTVFGASQEKLLNNFNHLTEKMQEIGEPVPFQSINDPKFVAAFKQVIAHHEHGWQGDGSKPSVGTEEYPNIPDYEWSKSPEFHKVPKDQFEFVNAMLADEGAKPPTRGNASISKAKAHLANENRRLINEAGEVNELRQRINEKTPPVDGKPWTKATLEDPLNENISPALTSNIGEASQSDESIRVHGKVGDLGRFFSKGKTPDRAKSAAGFMPEERERRLSSGTTERIRRELRSGRPDVIDKQSQSAFTDTTAPLANEPYGEIVVAGEHNPRPPEKIMESGDGVSHFAEERATKGYLRHRFVRTINGQPVSVLRVNEHLPTKAGDPYKWTPEKPGASTITYAYTKTGNRGKGFSSDLIEAADRAMGPKAPLSADFWNTSEMRRALARAAGIRKNESASFMPEDTGKPEQGGTPAERLAREAEAAGINLSAAHIRGLMTEDKRVMGLLRERIKNATGRPARFLPEESDVNEYGLFSQLARTIASKMPNSAPVAQVLAIARSGAKAEELKWSDIDGAVKRLAEERGGKVPKKALLDYLKTDGSVRFKEQRISDEDAGFDPALLNKIATAYSDKKVWMDRVETEYGNPREWPKEQLRELSKRNAEIAEMEAAKVEEEQRKNAAKPKFSQYTLPGGRNYREIVLTMPKSDPVPEYDSREGWGFRNVNGSFSKEKIGGGNDFESNHYPAAGNYIAHMRLADHTDASGKEGALIEELQSDRHQQGREKGYKGDSALTPAERAEHDRIDAIAVKERSNADQLVIDRLRTKMGQAMDGIPDAPLRKTWHEYQFRRALAEAVASGKEWVGWTTGETQADRYDLAKQVEEVKAFRRSDGAFDFMVKPNGERAYKDIDQIPESKLEENIGKELAAKVAKQESGWQTYSGLDLKVGGEGMKGFYDSIMPKYVSGYVKKWGAKVEKGNLKGGDDFDSWFEENHGDQSDYDAAQLRVARQEYRAQRTTKTSDTPIWQVAITPEMRAGVKSGQAKFMPDEGRPETPQSRAQERIRQRAAVFMPDDLERLAIKAGGIRKDNSETRGLENSVAEHGLGNMKSAPEGYVEEADGLQVGAMHNGKSVMGTLTGMTQVIPESVNIPKGTSRAFYRIKFDDPPSYGEDKLHEGLVSASTIKVLNRNSARFMPQDKAKLSPALAEDGKLVRTGQPGDTHAKLKLDAAKEDLDVTTAEHVFTDGKGRILTREEAYPIAEAAGLLNPEGVAKRARAEARGKKPQLESQDLKTE